MTVVIEEKNAMVGASAIDRVLESIIRRLHPIVRRVMTLTKPPYAWAVGILLGLPFILFLLLVSARVFHWWNFPWSERGTRWLLWWITLGAIVNALIYGFASLMFFLTWWRNKLSVPQQKRPRLALTYTFSPLLYGFVIAWGVTSLRGAREELYAYLALAMFVLMGFGATFLRISERNKALRSTA